MCMPLLVTASMWLCVKGYEHPEIVMKIISVLFDYSRYTAEDADEVNEYFALNVDPTARRWS